MEERKKYIVEGIEGECVLFVEHFLDAEEASKLCEKLSKDLHWYTNDKTNRAQVLVTIPSSHL